MNDNEIKKIDKQLYILEIRGTSHENWDHI